MSVIVNLPAPANPPVPAFDVSETLDGVQCVLHFQWNETDGSWYLRVLGQDATLPALMGDTRLVVDWPLYLSRIHVFANQCSFFKQLDQMFPVNRVGYSLLQVFFDLWIIAIPHRIKK